MRIRLTIPGEPNEETLGIALEAATRLAQHDVRSGHVPPIEEAIEQHGIFWKEEPPGDESFDPPHVVMERGNMDCDDAAPWLAAEMRETGYDQGAETFAVRSGPRTWHALVRGSDGEVYDPSKWAGMPHDVVGQQCACSKPINVGRIGLQVTRNKVRVDVPGLQSRRGCVIGTSHETDCEASDEGRVRAFIRTLEDAIVTAQLARTGDSRAIRALAVVYRVLRGDDPETACAGMGLRQDQVGVDFSAPAVRDFVRKAREVLATAADELFNGETWTMQNGRVVKARKTALSGISGHAWVKNFENELAQAQAVDDDERVGFIPCLAALGGLGTLAATAGTIAAVIEPIAAILEGLAGKDSDFGRAMQSIRDAMGPIKLVSSFGGALQGMLEGGAGLASGVQAGVARWFELLNHPGSPQAANLATLGEKTLTNVAKVLNWTEQALGKALPAVLAARLTPEVLDLVKNGFYKEAVKTMKDKTVKWVKEETGFDQKDIDKIAEQWAVKALDSLATHAESIDLVEIPEGSYVPAPEQMPEPYDVPQPGETAKREMSAPAAELLSSEIEEAKAIREQLRVVPAIADVPLGWDPIFALGCRQMTGQCSS